MTEEKDSEKVLDPFRVSGDTFKIEKSLHEAGLDFLAEQSKESSSEHYDSGDEEDILVRQESKIARMEV